MRLPKRKWPYLVALTLVVLGLSYSPKITREEAIAIADAQLRDYALTESISLSEFGSAEVKEMSNEPGWDISYESRGIPKHSVVVYVYPNGGSEVERDIEPPQ